VVVKGLKGHLIKSRGHKDLNKEEDCKAQLDKFYKIVEENATSILEEYNL